MGKRKILLFDTNCYFALHLNRPDVKRDDTLWKALLEDLFDDLLRFFYPNADTLFDMNAGFEYLDKELEQLFPPDDDIYAVRYVDKLVKVRTTEGNEDWILVHIEVQGYAEDEFPERMFQYYTRILDKYKRPITALAIFTDSNKNFQPAHYHRKYLGTEVLYKFNTFKIIDQNDAELEASNNPFALAVLTAKLAISRNKLNDEELFTLARDLAKRLLTRQIPKSKIRNLMSFLRYYIRFEKQEMFDKFVQEIEILTERTKTMGIEEFLLDRAEKRGIQKGIQKGITKGIEQGKSEKELEKDVAFTKSLLLSTDFSTLKIAELVGISEDFVLKVKKELGR